MTSTAASPASPWLPLLCERLPSGEVVVDEDILTTYARDQAPTANAGHPAALVRARSVDTVVTTLRLATEHEVPVVVRGAGTGLSGGANAVDGCIVLCLERMNRILEIDAAAGLARVEPGVINQHLDEAARELGLTYAPDPASRDISTLGGNVATNAGGACCVKYGVTGDHIAGLKAVLPSGEVISTGGAALKNVAGLDLQRLLIGSEGTLAVVVEITARLLPRKDKVGTLVAFFDQLDDAGRAIVELAQPRNLAKLEVMDQVTVQAVEALLHMELDTSAAALLLAQADGGDAEAVLQQAQEVCERTGASLFYATFDEAEGRMFFQARSAALPALEKKGRWLLDDVAVPVAAIPALLAACQQAAVDHGVLVGTFGHAGDGNLHPTLVYGDGEEAAAMAAFEQILHAAVALGGTITGEHGVGSLKRPYLEGMVGPTSLRLMRGIKAVFDPLGILNPGKGY